MIARLPRSGTVEVVVDASPDAVWAVLTDVTRIGEWSHECCRAEWLDGADAAAPGVRFRGSNRTGRMRWARVCTIRTVEPPYRFAWRTAGPRLMGDAADWQITLEPAGSGTRIRQEFSIVTLPTGTELMISTMIPSHRDRSAALRADLTRLGAAAGRVGLDASARSPDR